MDKYTNRPKKRIKTLHIDTNFKINEQRFLRLFNGKQT
jgi:hypothetical protein